MNLAVKTLLHLAAKVTHPHRYNTSFCGVVCSAVGCHYYRTVFHFAMASQLELTEEDVPGAKLEEPLESYTVPALRRWLLCHGIQLPTSMKKSAVIEKLVGQLLITS